MYSHTSRKIWDSFAPSKSGGGVDLYAGHSRSAYVPQIFPEGRMMSAELRTEGHFAP